MAIKRYNVHNYNSRATATANLAACLQEHAVPKYFDSVVLSEDGESVHCYVGDLFFLAINQTGNSTCGVGVALENGDGGSSALTGNTSSPFSCETVTECAHGLHLKFYEYAGGLTITKDNAGNTAVVYISGSSGKLPTTGTPETLRAATPKSLALHGNNVCLPWKFPVTTLAPIGIFSGEGHYLPNVFLMPYAQYPGEEGSLVLNGVRYVTNGLWAIKDE